MNKKIWYLCLLLFLLAGCSRVPELSQKTAPKVVEGVLDLSDWDFEKDGVVALDGEWDFYWNQLLTPEDFDHKPQKEKTGWIKIPGIWNGYQTQEGELSGKGFATFKLTVKLSDINGLYGLKLLDVATAYQLWVNGKRLAFNGKVGKSKESMIPQFLPQTTRFQTSSANVQIVVQVSNYFHKKGGLPAAWQLHCGSQQHVLPLALQLGLQAHGARALWAQNVASQP